MKKIFFLLLFHFSLMIHAQSEYVLMGYDYRNNYENYILNNNINAHLLHAPFIIHSAFVKDSSRMYESKKSYNQLWKKILFADNLIHVNKDVELRIDPVLDFNYGKQIKGVDKSIFQNTKSFYTKNPRLTRISSWPTRART